MIIRTKQKDVARRGYNLFSVILMLSWSDSVKVQSTRGSQCFGPDMNQIISNGSQVGYHWATPFCSELGIFCLNISTSTTSLDGFCRASIRLPPLIYLDLFYHRVNFYLPLFIYERIYMVKMVRCHYFKVHNLWLYIISVFITGQVNPLLTEVSLPR